MAETAKRAFLIMPFSNELDWLHGDIVGAGVSEGLTIDRADDIFESGSILGQILARIDEADIVVAVCTGKNPNVFFELGYAWLRHSPILIADNDDDLPSDVSAFRTIMYGGDKEQTSKATLKFRLRKAMRAALDSPGLPKGRVVSSLKADEDRPALTGRTASRGKNLALVVANSGNVPVYDVDISIPEDVQSIFIHSEDLPVSELRAGESVSVQTLGVMGGGPRIFDATISAKTASGAEVLKRFKVSL